MKTYDQVSTACHIYEMLLEDGSLMDPHEAVRLDGIYMRLVEALRYLDPMMRPEDADPDPEPIAKALADYRAWYRIRLSANIGIPLRQHLADKGLAERILLGPSKAEREASLPSILELADQSHEGHLTALEWIMDDTDTSRAPSLPDEVAVELEQRFHDALAQHAKGTPRATGA